MKKLVLICAACAMLFGQQAMAQNEVKEDVSQGYLFNKFSDNWFITLEGGVSTEFYQDATKLKFGERLGPAASLYVGKWFSPIVGLRLGANWITTKNLSHIPDYIITDAPLVDGLYTQKFGHVGPVADAMVNLTNWWCGYRPGRVYNAIIYGGAGGYWSFYKTKQENGFFKDWENCNDRLLTVRAGLINSFNITKNFALALDLRYSAVDCHGRFRADASNRTINVLQAYLTATVLFNKTDWSAPTCPECAPAVDTSALEAELADAKLRASELERQLDACLKRPATKVVEKVENEAPLATIYFPINVSKITAQDEKVLCAVAEVMKENPSQRYDVVGWADNYTGTDEINTRLRHERANTVAAQLINCGVPADQLNVSINSGNLNDLGEKFVALDRAVTIEKAK